MESKALVVVVALVLVGALAWFWLAESAVESDRAAAAPRALVVDTPPPMQELAPVAPAPSNERAAPVREEAFVSAPAPTQASSSEECAIFGRVVDEHGVALDGVTVRVSAYQGWAEGHDVPRLSGRADMRGFEGRTDARGEFRFDAPTPTVERVVLEITPDDYHDSAREFLGSSASRPPLHAGDNDLGEFVLVSTGAIAGRVTDAKGAPIADAELNIGDNRSNTYGRNGRSDADGRYVIAHVKPGAYGVNVKHEGHLSEFRKPYEVEAGRTTDGVDFVLAQAPTLVGVVVDASGAPVEGAKLWCWPQSSGQGAGAKSAADGGFTVFLPQNEPYSLEAKCEGFEPFGVGDRDVLYEPGARDLRIVLQRGVRTRFLVVEADTRAPIETFGIAVYREHYVEGPPTQLAQHPSGEVELPATPGLDRVVVRAPGFEGVQRTVTLDASSQNVMTVELQRAASLRGRAIFEGQPIAEAEVLLESGRADVRVVDGVLTVLEDSFRPEQRGRSSARTGADGRFVLAPVESGRKRLTITSSTGAVSTPLLLTVAAATEADLGDIELGLAATIAGRVLVPPRRELSGITIQLDGSSAGAKTVTDAAGAFRFDRVAPGPHTLEADSIPGRLADSEPLEVTVVAGQTSQVQLDLTACGTCDVALTILMSGRPTEGSTVYLVLEGARNAWRPLGRTDANGRVTGWVQAQGVARVRVMSGDGVALVHPTALLGLRLDETIDESLNFEFASLVVELPSSLDLPAHARLTLSGEALSPVNVTFSEGEVASGGTWELAGRRVRLPSVPVGEFELDCALYDLDSRTLGAPSVNGVFRAFEPIYRSKVRATVRAGAANELRLE